MKLNCSLCYTPANRGSKRVNYVCSDNKIHIRFRDYNSKQVIWGFEGKLTYLISYLFNYSYLPTVLNKVDDKKLINGFLSNSDLASILSCIRIFIQDSKITGFKLSKNYKKSDCKPFGDIDINCYPLNNADGIIESGSLKSFLKNFGLNSLEEYLFNDGYKVIIHEAKEVAENKYERKQSKKIQKLTRVDLVELW